MISYDFLGRPEYETDSHASIWDVVDVTKHPEFNSASLCRDVVECDDYPNADAGVGIGLSNGGLGNLKKKAMN